MKSKERKKNVKVVPIETKIIAKSSIISPCDTVGEGVVLTGFIDVEKLIKIRDKCEGERVIFLEKKLPFQILIVELEHCED
ncbi:hypothetical protein ACFYU8_08085 [Brevibacillus sp. NPDC003359]|uniref:hypothetical protein n=1 Tax=unclassified Brevibacillus TaxID=2684853 RepID=UPI0036895D6C